MNLYLVTDEFNKSAMETSFRATVLANDENSARWLVSQRSATFQIAEVAAAAAFCIATVEHAHEGVLTIVHDNGARLLRSSQFKKPTISEETFYEVEILDPELDNIPNMPCTEIKWYGVKSQPKYLMRRIVLRTDTPNLVNPGLYSNEYVAQQFFLVEQTHVSVDQQQWRYKPLGAHYKTQLCDLYNADLLEIRSSILRNANTLPGTAMGERLLQELWTFVRTEKGEGAVPVEGLEFYPGQELYWMADDAREWAMTLPQIVGDASPTFLETDLATLAGTNCVTIK